MANFELLMPKLGESIEEATITRWFVKEGDQVEDDDVLLEIATDKVDSEIPSPVSGTIHKILAGQDETVAVGAVIALIGTGGKEAPEETTEAPESRQEKPESTAARTEKEQRDMPDIGQEAKDQPVREKDSRFYSPLVLTIAKEEGISMKELESIPGSGRNGRVQKKDLLNFISNRKASPAPEQAPEPPPAEAASGKAAREKVKGTVSPDTGQEIIEMDRMRKLIAEHMVRSKQTSAHVTNMLETDVTEIVLWRNRIKEQFQQREGEKITYLPVFLEAVIQALKAYPMINSSVDGDRIIIKKNLNLGIAVALASGNLIVPVIKNAESLNLLGLTKALNKLADDARHNRLSPDDISGGTFTVSNFGTFGNVMGTPIINQPQVAILAVGTVEKKPAVIETPTGDVIGIRHKMFLSLTYDHRIIDGAYGGAFLRKLGEILESFDGTREI